MSSTSEKLRAVFLTALMIGSVFAAGIAFTGGAAAESVNVTDSNVTPNTVDTDSTNTYTVNVTIENANTTSNTDDAYANFTFANLDLSSASVTNQEVVSTGANTNTTNVDTNYGNNSNNPGFVNISWDGEGSLQDDTIQISFDVESVVAPSTISDQQVLLTADTDADGSSDLSGYGVQTIDVGTDQGQTYSESTDSVVDANAEVNVSITDVDGVGVAEGTINVSVYNEQTNENISLVESGTVVNGTVLDSANFTDGTNNVTEHINLSVALPEGTYQINASAEDIYADSDSSDDIGDGFKVNMAGDALKVIPDDSNPLAGSQANVSLVAVDQNGNELVFNDSNVHATSENLQLSFDDPDNVTNVDRTVSGTHDDEVPIYNSSSYNVTYGVNYSEVGDLEITANDFGGNLSSGSATQTYTAEIAGVTVDAEDGTVLADGSDTETVTLQLVDQNGDPVPRSGVTTDFGIISGNAGDAGINVTEMSETNASGVATAVYNATEAGYTIEVAGQTNNYQDTTTFNTTPGDINAAQSSFELGVGNGTDDIDKTEGVQVASEHDLKVTLKDDEGNAIVGAPVTVTANGSELASSPLTTNETGVATDTVTLPEEAGTTQYNVSAGAFNASATGDASINVTTNAENVTALQIAEDAPTNLAPQSEDNTVEVEAVDQYGNVNTSAAGTVTLTSSDAAIVDFDGAASADSDFTNGVASFNADANGTGTATLSATIPDGNISNTSYDVSIADPAGIELSFNHNVATSDATSSSTRTTAMLEAQFVDADGDDLGIAGQNISFARDSGNAAELNQSLEQFTKTTDGDGNVTIQVNGTANTGETTFLALAENYSVQSSSTITTTGVSDSIQVTAESSTVEQGSSMNVTASFVDSEDRVVPRTQSIQLSPDSGNFTTATKKTSFNADGEAVANYVYNAPTDTAGDVSITAVGGGITGSSTITVTEVAETEGVQIENVSVDPSTVTPNTTNDHMVTFDAVNVSDDGNTDTFEVAFPSTTSVDNINDVSVVDADGETVAVTGSAELVNNGVVASFDVSPDSSADYRDLTVTVNATVSAPDVENVTTADVTASITDSSNGEDSASTTLTIQPEGAAPAVVGDSPAQDLDNDGAFEDVNGDGTFDIVDVNAFFQNRQSSAVQDNAALFDYNGDGTVDIVDVNLLFQNSQA